MTQDMFSSTGIRPRRSPRIMMKMIDVGQDNSGPVIIFECSKCGHSTGWIKDDQSVTQNKRGKPCPICN